MWGTNRETLSPREGPEVVGGPWPCTCGALGLGRAPGLPFPRLDALLLHRQGPRHLQRQAGGPGGPLPARPRPLHRRPPGQALPEPACPHSPEGSCGGPRRPPGGGGRCRGSPDVLPVPPAGRRWTGLWSRGAKGQYVRPLRGRASPGAPRPASCRRPAPPARPHSPRAASCTARRRCTRAPRPRCAATAWWWSCDSWCSRGRRGGWRTVGRGGQCEPAPGAAGGGRTEVDVARRVRGQQGDRPQFPHRSAVSRALPSAVTACSQPGCGQRSRAQVGHREWPGRARVGLSGASVPGTRSHKNPSPANASPLEAHGHGLPWSGKGGHFYWTRPPFPAPTRASLPSAPQGPGAWHTQGAPPRRVVCMQTLCAWKNSPPKACRPGPPSPGRARGHCKPCLNRVTVRTGPAEQTGARGGAGVERSSKEEEGPVGTDSGAVIAGRG